MKDDKIYCVVCGKEIPTERLECGFKKCIDCQNEQPYIGFTNVTHKTGNDTVFVKANDTEALRKAIRANRRAR
jgi:hypothetical protein